MIGKNWIKKWFQKHTRTEDNMIDQEKTGKFIAEMRKEAGLTQKQLAEQLDITDKAISKWETGRSMPDNSIILELCSILNISINELLSGEKISEENYSPKAEENMMVLMKESHDQKKNTRHTVLGTTMGFLVIIAAVLLIMADSAGISGLVHFIDFYALLCVIGMSFIILGISGILPDFFRAFRVCYGKTTDRSQIQTAITAMKAFMCTLPPVAFLVSAIFFIHFLHSLNTLEEIGPILAVLVLSVLYSSLIEVLLIPTLIRLIRKERANHTSQ